ncbi:hypothetical protein ILUMI_12629 [Ignelater luminosus]|uniref:Uncharacterized protein n=1 Tax=Ignelater luminosus TaxID=2038154 RepID=A0A8K0CXS4_IGNLU|nr:hypothetical protein ILUMI_12629 [Ignelater luminosus]
MNKERNGDNKKILTVREANNKKRARQKERVVHVGTVKLKQMKREIKRQKNYQEIRYNTQDLQQDRIQKKYAAEIEENLNRQEITQRRSIEENWKTIEQAKKRKTKEAVEEHGERESCGKTNSGLEEESERPERMESDYKAMGLNGLQTAYI